MISSSSIKELPSLSPPQLVQSQPHCLGSGLEDLINYGDASMNYMLSPRKHIHQAQPKETSLPQNPCRPPLTRTHMMAATRPLPSSAPNVDTPQPVQPNLVNPTGQEIATSRERHSSDEVTSKNVKNGLGNSNSLKLCVIKSSKRGPRLTVKTCSLSPTPLETARASSTSGSSSTRSNLCSVSTGGLLATKKRRNKLAKLRRKKRQQKTETSDSDSCGKQSKDRKVWKKVDRDESETPSFKQELCQDRYLQIVRSPAVYQYPISAKAVRGCERQIYCSFTDPELASVDSEMWTFLHKVTYSWGSVKLDHFTEDTNCYYHNKKYIVTSVKRMKLDRNPPISTFPDDPDTVPDSYHKVRDIFPEDLSSMCARVLLNQYEEKLYSTDKSSGSLAPSSDPNEFSEFVGTMAAYLKSKFKDDKTGLIPDDPATLAAMRARCAHLQQRANRTDLRRNDRDITYAVMLARIPSSYNMFCRNMLDSCEAKQRFEDLEISNEPEVGPFLLSHPKSLVFLFLLVVLAILLT